MDVIYWDAAGLYASFPVNSFNNTLKNQIEKKRTKEQTIDDKTETKRLLQESKFSLS